MRRFVWRGLGLLLRGVVALPLAAQRSPGPAVVLEEPRAYPVFPAAMVPFTIAPEVCRRGHVPTVALRVYNSLSQPVAVFHLRDRPSVALDSVPLKCGEFVGLWDGTVDRGTRTASPGLYWVNLIVDGEPKTKRLIITLP